MPCSFEKYFEKYCQAMNDYGRLLNYYKACLDLVDSFHFNSETARNVYFENYGDASGEVIPITHSGIKDNRRKKSFDSAVLRIGFIGNDTPYKGLPLLLKALRQMRSRDLWRLDVWGGKVGNDNHGQVHYKGKFDSRSVAAVYEGMDVLVVPSIWKETFGFVVLEALSYGVPVIVSDNVGAKDIVRLYDERFVFTSWAGLSALLDEIVNDRFLLVNFNGKILDGEWDYSMEDHAGEILRLYEL